jgi:hypothetical protein
VTDQGYTWFELPATYRLTGRLKWGIPKNTNLSIRF